MEGPAEANAPAKKATGPPRFDRAKGPPTFTRGGKGSVAINKNEFPDLGDFPSMDASAKSGGGGTFKTQGMAAAEQDMRPKCEQSGSFTMNTAIRAPRQEGGAEAEKRIEFKSSRPMFFSSKNKNKNDGPGVNADIHEKQNYDFSKFQTSSTTTRRPRNEEGEVEEGKDEEGAEKPAKTENDGQQQEIRERRPEKRQQKEFDPLAGVPKKEAPVEDEDGFTFVNNVQRTKPIRSEYPASSSWKEPNAQARKVPNNRFATNANDDDEGWNMS